MQKKPSRGTAYKRSLAEYSTIYMMYESHLICKVLEQSTTFLSQK